MVRYIWQRSSWPKFRQESAEILGPLGRTRLAQGRLLGNVSSLGLEFQAENLIEEACTTASIEGEKLERESVRSSVAKRLGLPTAGLPPSTPRIDGLVEMLLDATRHHAMPLTASRLKGWQAALFPTGYSGMNRIVVGDWRSGDSPMQVVSGPVGKERIHYEAPPADRVDREMNRFLKWFQSPHENMDGIVRAATAHFWFVSIHPFQEGNGRVARAIADMALAQDENSGLRLHSMSAQIISERRDYYRILEKAQKGTGDITEWTIWFIECLGRAIGRSNAVVEKSRNRDALWKKIAHIGLNDRQRKVIARLIEAGPRGFEGGLTNRKYRNMTKTTRETAKRDIADLVTKGILLRNPGGGRSISYDLDLTT